MIWTLDLCGQRCHRVYSTECITGISPPLLSSMELRKIGFSHHPISSWQLILSFQESSLFPFILMILIKFLQETVFLYLYILYQISSRGDAAPLFLAYCFVEFILWFIKSAIPTLNIILSHNKFPFPLLRCSQKSKMVFGFVFKQKRFFFWWWRTLLWPVFCQLNSK